VKASKDKDQIFTDPVCGMKVNIYILGFSEKSGA
jgi:hypothetical protein